MVEPTRPQWSARLAFRDDLRENSAVRDEYAALKASLAERFRNDHQADTDGKGKFITEIIIRESVRDDECDGALPALRNSFQ
jgi:GrpB-like predicted nucleotidyltransferase (UPF0157 family)